VYCHVGKGVVDVTLDAFFPFDPLPLKKCRVYVEGLFQKWNSCEEDDVDGEY